MASRVLGSGTFRERGAALAAERGLTLEKFVCAVVEEQGSLSAAAHFLHVNRNTVRYYLRKAGLIPVTRYSIHLETSND